ncbi:hypothetical protein GCM10022222_67160 [Amycolatopsis ultiminotia]|uniref:Transposase n=1 Tax=Amycolatopsis ultiminotia TaxID=543629 RepID=A0ABP6XXH3_9PSEU
MHPESENASAGASGQAALTPDEQAELAWLRAENSLLRAEKDLLLKAAAGFAADAGALRAARPSEPKPR